MVGFIMGISVALLACILFMVVLIARSISRQENELEERKRNLQKKLDAIYPPGYLPGIDPEPKPPKLRKLDTW
jgi:hypothetical protein|nr:MAG TPA: protein of unknown function (DUF4083) [Caudoviricetes sp.]